MTTAMETDTMEKLGEKLKAVAKVNEDIIETVQGKQNATVVGGFSYAMRCQSSNPTKWTLTASPQSMNVQERLQAWCYKGKPLQVPEDVFNDKINYEMVSYTDVFRLNEELLKVGSKYCDRLADTPKNRQDVRLFLDKLDLKPHRLMVVSIPDSAMVTFNIERLQAFGAQPPIPFAPECF